MSKEENITKTIDGHLNVTAHKKISDSSGGPFVTVSIAVAVVSLTLIIVIGSAFYFYKRSV